MMSIANSRELRKILQQPVLFLRGNDFSPQVHFSVENANLNSLRQRTTQICEADLHVLEQ